MKNILCFGDSNTHGYIPGGGRYDYQTRWTGILAGLLGRDYYVLEEGLNGRTSSFDDPFDPYKNALNYIVPCIQTHEMLDLTILMLGSNDMKKYFSPTTQKISDSIENLTKIIKETSNSRVLLISPIQLGEHMDVSSFEPEFPPSSVAISHELGSALKKVAKRQQVDFLDASEFANPSLADSLHLTPDGHRSLAHAIYNKIRELNL